MTALAGAQSCGEVIRDTCRERPVRMLLLARNGTPAVYRVGDLLSQLLYDGYSFRDQTLSGRTIGSNQQSEPLSWISI